MEIGDVRVMRKYTSTSDWSVDNVLVLEVGDEVLVTLADGDAETVNLIVQDGTNDYVEDFPVTLLAATDSKAGKLAIEYKAALGNLYGTDYLGAND